jgi:hypothetical protein
MLQTTPQGVDQQISPPVPPLMGHKPVRSHILSPTRVIIDALTERAIRPLQTHRPNCVRSDKGGGEQRHLLIRIRGPEQHALACYRNIDTTSIVDVSNWRVRPLSLILHEQGRRNAEQLQGLLFLTSLRRPPNLNG